MSWHRRPRRPRLNPSKKHLKPAYRAAYGPKWFTNSKVYARYKAGLPPEKGAKKVRGMAGSAGRGTAPGWRKDSDFGGYKMRFGSPVVYHYLDGTIRDHTGLELVLIPKRNDPSTVNMALLEDPLTAGDDYGFSHVLPFLDGKKLAPILKKSEAQVHSLIDGKLRLPLTLDEADGPWE